MKHTVEEVKLKNGARGLLIDVPDATVMSSQFHFRAGNRYVRNKEIYETAHVMEHMAFGANEKFRSEHAYEQEFTKNGAYHNAYTSDYAMVYEAVWNCAIVAPRPPVPPPGDNGDAVARNTEVKKHLIQFHLLKDEVAYKSEGQVMHHCVASYWQLKPSQRKIFSMRNSTTNERLVTIEVNGNSVIQARGVRNAEPNDDQKYILKRFYEAMGFSERSYIGTYVLGAGVNNLQNLARNVQLQPRIDGLPLHIGPNGPQLFEYMTTLEVQTPMQYDHTHEARPTVRIEGSVTREGLAALQRLMNGG
jgi:hypothetical protein